MTRSLFSGTVLSDQIIEMAKPLFKDHGANYEGHHISNSTIVIK